MVVDAFQNVRHVTQLLPHLLTNAKIKPAVILVVSWWSGRGVSPSEQS